MIAVRKAGEGQYERHGQHEEWRSFSAGGATSSLGPGSLGALVTFREGRLPPRVGTREPRQDAEIITYVRDGTMSFEDSAGHTGLISAGEFQRMTAGRGIRYSEANASPTDWAHVFQIWLHPSEATLEPGHEQKRFAVADRRGVLCVVASPDGRNGSLRVHQDAVLYSSILERGQHVIHELVAGRAAWLHIVHGAATLGTIEMTAGDGAGISAERCVSLTANDATEVLLLDLGEFAGVVVPTNGAPGGAGPEWVMGESRPVAAARRLEAGEHCDDPPRHRAGPSQWTLLLH